jgi:hypothetical protein
MINPVAYMISNFIIQIPLMFIMSVFALSVSAYGRSLPLVHFSAQPEPFLSLKGARTRPLIKGLSLVDLSA